ncbi:MAG TPA: PKD domain-containing protein, partial [Candidatus Thermoplasmatota archaeon]|nr:PKD domain-containing protein [Candidatus Thermoplasmatota archaeon]
DGVAPVVELYYWGDDISPACLEDGCWSTLHDTWKSRGNWSDLTGQLAEHLRAKLDGKPAVVVLETEFNKAGVATYEPLDGWLADRARQLRDGYPNASIALGFGNWGRDLWGTWDRAMGASDMAGLQALRGSTRDTAAAYDSIVDAILAGARRLQGLFGKPVLVHDLALSSYPEPAYRAHQEDAIRGLFERLDELQAAGVEGIVYRALRDDPGFDTANYYGEAERHWGLTYANGTWKPAMRAWVEGVQAERRPPRVGAANAAPSARFVVATQALAASFDATTSSDPDGDALTFAWDFGDGARGAGARVSHTYPTGGRYVARLTVRDGLASDDATLAVRVNRPPVAGLNAATHLLEATLDAGASRDPDGDAMNFTWDFGDGSRASGKRVTHPYRTGGTYTVKLTAKDGLASDTASLDVTVNRPPVAGMNNATHLLEATLDAGASRDPDRDAMNFTWDFGDGSRASGKRVTHAYATGGTYLVQLTASDGLANATASRPVRVNRPPVAGMNNATHLLEATLDAGASRDPDRDTMNFTWDFGDGSRASGKRVTHAYATGGTYLVQLTASDGLATATALRSVTVNRPPVANLTTTIEGMEARADGRRSSDPDGDALRYLWDFGDGATAEGAEVAHVYTEAGVYPIRLTVWDASPNSMSDAADEVVQVRQPGLIEGLLDAFLPLLAPPLPGLG